MVKNRQKWLKIIEDSQEKKMVQNDQNSLKLGRKG
jgi:hypothetical protein